MNVRHFFVTEYPRDIIVKIARGASPTKDDYQRSERALDARGWVAVNWPKEAGGTGWTSNQKYIFDEELERAGAAPSVASYLGTRAQSIYGGSNEIQKNIIAKRILGL